MMKSGTYIPTTIVRKVGSISSRDRVLCSLLEKANAYEGSHYTDCDWHQYSDQAPCDGKNGKNRHLSITREIFESVPISNSSAPVCFARLFAVFISSLVQLSKMFSMSAVLKAACPTG